jgi:hypothetical protein
MTNLETFKTYIKTLSNDELPAYGVQLENKLKRARKPATKLGYALGLDEIHIEIQLRKPIDATIDQLSDDELLTQLNS